ncbi:Zinc finger MYND-type [Trinorchestia longiramus]|nr:Zinc finger MYND-type [Trinorchestia longiramus]
MTEKFTMREGQRVRKGDLLMRTEPFVHTLYLDYKNKFCDQCFKKRPLEPCPGCGVDFYCCDECRQVALPLHALECDQIQQFAPATLSDFARFLAKTILKLKNGGDKEWVTIDNKLRHQFRHMRQAPSAVRKCSQYSEDVAAKKKELQRFFGDRYSLPDEFFVDVYFQLKTNSFGVMDETGEPLGEAIYIDVAIYKHSCRPNAVLSFEGTQLSVRATADAPKYHRDLFRHSYISVFTPRAVRQEQLLSGYGFECRCERCADEDLEAVENSVNCGNPKCSYPVEIPAREADSVIVPLEKDPQLQCPRCRYKGYPPDFEDRYWELVDEYEEVFDFYEYPENDEDLKYVVNYAIAQVRRRQSKQEGGHNRMVMHPFNVHRVRLLEAASGSALRLGYAAWALRFSELNIDGIRHCCGEYGPHYGHSLLQQGKLCVRLQRYKKAARYFRQASSSLQVSRGPDCRLLQEEVYPLLEATQQVWGLVKSSTMSVRDFERMERMWKLRQGRKVRWGYYAYAALIATMLVLGVTSYR